MKNWKYKVKIKHILDHDNVSAQEISKQIGAVLNTTVRSLADKDFELSDIIDRFINECVTVDDVDGALFELYEWADFNSCWIE